MNRYKSYDATGVAPNGRLYAGDLNMIQDLVAALADFTQALQVASVEYGEAGLSLSKYGVGEILVAGMMRVSGIFRALSGIIPGSYTSVVRDAITAPPNGLMILNTDTNQFEWNSGTSGAPVWEAVSLRSLGTTKGDMIVFTGAGVPVRVGIGAVDGQIWTVDSTAVAGASWKDAPAPGISLGLAVGMS